MLAGAMLGVLVTITGVVVSGGWYEYRWLSSVFDARDHVNDDGWHVVPGQVNDRYLRRPRLRFN